MSLNKHMLSHGDVCKGSKGLNGPKTLMRHGSEILDKQSSAENRVDGRLRFGIRLCKDCAKMEK